MKSQLVRADFLQHRPWPPQTRPAARTASLGRRVPLAHPRPTAPPPPPIPSSISSPGAWGGGRLPGPFPLTSHPPPPSCPSPQPPSLSGRPSPSRRGCAGYSLARPGRLALHLNQAPPRLLPSLIREGGSGALNLCLPLQGGCNSTPPPFPTRPRPPPPPPAHSHTRTHTHTS